MAKDDEVKYDPVTGLNESGYTREESAEIEFNAQKSREHDPARAVWAQENITATKLMQRAATARAELNGHHTNGWEVVGYGDR